MDSEGPFPAEAPEHGSSLLCSPGEATLLRQRRERSAVLGSRLLATLGAVSASAATALWITTRVSYVAVGVLAFGVLLIGLGVLLYRILARDRRRWPEELHAWDEGIELLLHDGELRAAPWTDPRLALDVFVRHPRRSNDAERLLVWRMGTPVPPCDLSREGFDRLMDVVVSRGHELVEYRRGAKGRESRAVEIRGARFPNAVGATVAPAETAQPTP